MKNIFTLLAAVLLTATTFAQVGIGTSTPHASAALDLTSTTGGLLLPRMTNAQCQAISPPVAGLMVYVTDLNGGSFVFYDGNSWSAFVTNCTTVPDAPTIGTATAADSGATVSFTAPSSNGGSTITSYTATATSTTDTHTISVTQSGSGSITVTGLTNGTSYTFTVTATNAIGTSVASVASNSVVPANIPDAPTIGTAVAGNAQATVPFTAPSSNGGSAITSYTATSSPGNITGTLSQAGSGTITVTGLTNGTSYTFTVTATNAIGTSLASSASNSVVPVTIPDAPTIGTAVATSDAQATVPFTAPSSNGGSAITSYTATSNPGGITGTISQSGSGDITVTGLTNGTSYTFTVTATNAIGTSVASEASNSVTPLSSIGNFYQGGVVFYIFVDGDSGYIEGETHGLIAAVQDQSSGIRWYYGSTGATGSAVGTGSANTDEIISYFSGTGTTETSYAAGLARAYDGGGYNDWFLPSKVELNEMYTNKTTINTTAALNGGSDFSTSYYWSSTEAYSSRAWRQGFTSGGQDTKDKDNTYYVRAVRAF